MSEHMHKTVERGEQLRLMGVEFASIITRNPAAWRDTERWLLNLPRCRAMAETSNPSKSEIRKRRMVRDRSAPASIKWYFYDDEADVSTKWGPLALKLRDAWQASTYRFSQRFSDRFFDFALVDARRVALLLALTFDCDFDGTPLAFAWPYESPQGSPYAFEGRCWVWAIIASGPSAEEQLLELGAKAKHLLDSKPGVASAVHSPDFKSVTWYGTSHSFNPTQAAVVKLLWEQWERDPNLAMGEVAIGGAIGSGNSRYRLAHTFRVKGKAHPAWGSMIQRVGKGTYQLRSPNHQ